MSEAVFREHIEQIWNNKNARAIERFIAPNYRGFDGAEAISGIEGYKRHFVGLTTGFPDLRITIASILEAADRVAARWVVDATHTGNFGDFPPTGLRVRVTGMAIARITNGQLVEEHANSDALGLLKQIGVIPESVKVAPLIF
jgi:predicted ester cyclase